MLLIKNFTRGKINQKYLNRIVDKTLRIAKFKKPAEISLVIVGEKRIRTLNKKYRKINRVTDILSFGNETAKIKKAKFINPPGAISYLGETFICYDQAKKQAVKQGHSVKKELAILLAHGVLHLLGYDHERSIEAEVMRKKEKMVLEIL